MTIQSTGCELLQLPHHFQLLVLTNYKMEYIIDALTTDVPLSEVHCVHSSSITCFYPSLLLLLTPALCTNELPGWSVSVPPISPASLYSTSVTSNKMPPYLSPAPGSITGRVLHGDFGVFFRNTSLLRQKTLW